MNLPSETVASRLARVRAAAPPPARQAWQARQARQALTRSS